jgi:hypothetical protein
MHSSRRQITTKWGLTSSFILRRQLFFWQGEFFAGWQRPASGRATHKKIGVNDSRASPPRVFPVLSGESLSRALTLPQQSF